MTSRTTQGAATAGQAAPPRRSGPCLLVVVRITDLTPHMRRITLGGDEIAGFPSDHQGSHVKVFIPRPSQVQPVLPTLGDKGPIWPPADQRPFARTYTIRRFNAAAGELDLDFVLHGDNGPASAWAINAKPGDRVGIAGPGGRGPIPQDAKWYLFVGDETALPAISAHLETLPATARGLAFVEIADAAEEQPLDYQAQIQLTWLHRNGATPGRTTLLEDAVRQIEWPDTPVFAWVAAEASATAAVRTYLRHERGLARNQIDAIPFWKAGLAEEVYHEERHETMDRDAVE